MIELVVGIYVTLGLFLATLGPAGKSIRREVEKTRGTEFTNAMMQREAPSEKKLFFFKLTLILGFSLLWPFLIWGALKENKNYEVQPDSDDFQNKGLKFQYMGGHGKLSCNECNFSESLTSFTHGIRSSRTGYQCQDCGKLASRMRTDPFKRSSNENFDVPLSELPLDERPSRIEHLQQMLNLCKSQMKKTARKNWLPTWEKTVAECTQELSSVDADELEEIKNKRREYEDAYLTLLLCECGGKLDRDSVLFCPECKSQNLSYSMEYIT